MISISLCMIVRDEEAVLDRCLRCGCQIADEIIVVDTGSSDRTVAIASQYTPHIHHFPWVDDFSAARNFAFSKATGDYILWLDADDVIDEEELEKLKALKEAFPSEVDVAMLRYQVGESDGGPQFSFYRERLLRNGMGFLWQEPVHEYIPVRGEVRTYNITITHGKPPSTQSTRNLEIYQRRMEKGLPMSPRAVYYYARELMTHGCREDAAAQFHAFLELPDIWVEDAISACEGLADCLCDGEDWSGALKALYTSFLWDLPRASTLCRIGAAYRAQKDYPKAIYWYSQALSAEAPVGWGFDCSDYRDYIPHIELCVIYDQMGDYQKAYEHHIQARRLRPQSSAVLHNEQYLMSKCSDLFGNGEARPAAQA